MLALIAHEKYWMCNTYLPICTNIDDAQREEGGFVAIDI
jgi:hypothetical protein